MSTIAHNVQNRTLDSQGMELQGVVSRPMGVLETESRSSL